MGLNHVARTFWNVASLSNTWQGYSLRLHWILFHICIYFFLLLFYTKTVALECINSNLHVKNTMPEIPIPTLFTVY